MLRWMSEPLVRLFFEYSCSRIGRGADVLLGPTFDSGSPPLLEIEGVYAAYVASEVGATRLTVSLVLSCGKVPSVFGDIGVCDGLKRDKHGDEGRRCPSNADSSKLSKCKGGRVLAETTLISFR